MTEPRLYRPYTYCSFCAQPFAPDQAWPRRCASCGNTTYRNPLPVAVVLVFGLAPPLRRAPGPSLYSSGSGLEPPGSWGKGPRSASRPLLT